MYVRQQSTQPVPETQVALLQRKADFLQLILLISIIFEFPFSSTHWTVLFQLLSIQPFQYTVHVKAVRAFPPHKRTVIAGNFAVRAAAVKLRPTDATRVVVRLPVPNSNTSPLLDCHFDHSRDFPG